MIHTTTKMRRKYRVRNKVRRVPSADRPRLSVFRSSKHIYAQVIDDIKGITLVAASTLEADLKGLKTGADKEAATKVGQLLAKRAKKAGVEKVVFDRGSYAYHGRVQALADGVRDGGIEF